MSRPAAQRSAICLRSSFSLTVIMVRESTRPIPFICDSMLARPCDNKRTGHRMYVSWLTCQTNFGGMLLRSFARRELAFMLNGFAVNILQVERGMQDAAIAAEALGFIKRRVRLSHQCGLVEGRFGAG